jgi:hypothetical protein
MPGLCSCFCRLLEQLHLLDSLSAGVAAEDQAQQQAAEQQQQQQDEQERCYKVRQLLLVHMLCDAAGNILHCAMSCKRSTSACAGVCRNAVCHAAVHT